MERIGKYQSTLGQIDLAASAGRIPTGYVGMTKELWRATTPRARFMCAFTRWRAASVSRIIPIGQRKPLLPHQSKSMWIWNSAWGVGRDRTNGAVGYLVAGGSYTDATIS